MFTGFLSRRLCVWNIDETTSGIELVRVAKYITADFKEYEFY